jgi:hypothetical protein
MDVWMRIMSIIIEVFFLTALVVCLLSGTWLTIFDLGLKPKYRRAIMMPLVALGCAAVAFFVAHLISFYTKT